MKAQQFRIVTFATCFVLTFAVSVVHAQSESKASATPEAAPTAEAATPLTVGDTIPKTTVQDADGNDVDLNALIAKQPTALVFYRGGWCPFCNKHLKDVADLRGDIAAAGYQIVAISADRPDDVKKFAAKKEFPYLLLSDSDMSTARQFGVAFKLDDATLERYQGFGIKLEDTQGHAHNSLPVPTFYLIDPDGTITFEYHNPDYKVRISKDAILEAIGQS